jgi:hypothetical protein
MNVWTPREYVYGAASKLTAAARKFVADALATVEKGEAARQLRVLTARVAQNEAETASAEKAMTANRAAADAALISGGNYELAESKWLDSKQAFELRTARNAPLAEALSRAKAEFESQRTAAVVQALDAVRARAQQSEDAEASAFLEAAGPRVTAMAVAVASTKAIKRLTADQFLNPTE